MSIYLQKCPQSQSSRVEKNAMMALIHVGKIWFPEVWKALSIFVLFFSFFSNESHLEGSISMFEGSQVKMTCLPDIFTCRNHCHITHRRISSVVGIFTRSWTFLISMISRQQYVINFESGLGLKTLQQGKWWWWGRVAKGGHFYCVISGDGNTFFIFVTLLSGSCSEFTNVFFWGEQKPPKEINDMLSSHLQNRVRNISITDFGFDLWSNSS